MKGTCWFCDLFRRRISQAFLRKLIANSHAMVLSRNSAPVDPGRTLARRAVWRAWPCYSGAGMAAALFALGEIAAKCLRNRGAITWAAGVAFLAFISAIVLFSISRLPLDSKENPVAAAQPVDRHLRFHRGDPGGLASGDGWIIVTLRTRRAVRCSFVVTCGAQCPVEESRGSECGSQQ